MSTDTFGIQEYRKLMTTLGLDNKPEREMDEDKSVYFNAWSFGYQQGDYQYAISTATEE